MPEDTTSTTNGASSTNLNIQSASDKEVNKFDLEIRFAGFSPESDRMMDNTSDDSSSDTTSSGSKKSPITIDESGKYVFDLTQLNINNIVIKLESKKPNREEDKIAKQGDRENDRT